jgi:predicted acyltransferase
MRPAPVRGWPPARTICAPRCKADEDLALGLCTIAAAPLALFCSWRQQAAVGLALLLVYTLLPGQDSASALDRWLMDGHLWSKARTWDPVGLLSTLPAVSSQLAADDGEDRRLLPGRSGRAAGGVGEVLNAWSMPINKSPWTPAYVFAMAGWASLVFAVFHWLLDAQALVASAIGATGREGPRRTWSRPA